MFLVYMTKTIGIIMIIVSDMTLVILRTNKIVDTCVLFWKYVMKGQCPYYLCFEVIVGNMLFWYASLVGKDILLLPTGNNSVRVILVEVYFNCDRPPQTSSKVGTGVGINFLNKISYNL